MLQHRCKALSFPIFLSTLLLSLVPLVTQAKITTNDLYLAVKQGEVSTVKQLISAGVDVNTVWGYASGSKGTPLLVAIKQTDIDMLRLLISLGADVNLHTKYAIKDKYNAGLFNYPVRPALSAAVTKAKMKSIHLDGHKTHLQIIKLLLDNGAKTPYGWINLSDAVSNSDEELVKLLLTSEQIFTSAKTSGNPLLEANARMAVILRAAGLDGEPRHERSAKRAAEGWIENDAYICGSVRSNNFKKLVTMLKDLYNTTLEESYFKIKCGRRDILGMVVENPADRYFVGRNLQRYFIKKINNPEMFSRILVTKIRSSDILYRIEAKREDIKGSSILENAFNKKLNSMHKKYIIHLEKYPVPGSVESVKAARNRNER